MKNILSSLLLLAYLFCGNAAFAQGEDDFCYVTLKLKAADEKIERARFYQSARENIKVEFTQIIFKNGANSFGKKYFATYNKEKNAWTARLPKGEYRFRTQHIGFDDYRETVECKQPTLIMEKELKVKNLSYTYENGRKYDYIRGGIEFSETIVVHFKSGTPDENNAFLETFPFEKVQKLRYTNSFFLTLNLANQESLPEILIREALDDEPLNEGFYFGDAITKTIEKLMENPNVKYAEPSFVFPKQSIEVLSKKDFSTVESMTGKLKDRNADEPKRLNPDEFEKSDELQQKLLRELEGN